MAALEQFNEGATVLITATFKDDNGTLVVPTEAQYQIDDVGSATEIQALTALSGSLASAMEIEILPAKNLIVNSTNKFETRLVTVRFKYGAGGTKQGADEYPYELKNLKGTKLT